MRTRKEIEQTGSIYRDVNKAILETLLDIRDLLALHAPEVTEKHD